MKDKQEEAWPSNEKDVVVVRLSLKAYEVEAVQAAAYGLMDRVNMIVNIDDKGENIIVNMSSKEKTPIKEETKNDFSASIIDHQVRLNLEKKFGNIRDIIVRQAFLPVDLSKEIKEIPE